MKTKYKDWTIDVQKHISLAFGPGYMSTAFVSKTSGLKADVRMFYRFDGIKSLKQMLEYTQKCLDL